MATLPLSTYIDKSVTHIKISRVDEQGNDNTLSLQELDSIRIITQDSGFPEYLDFAITSISEFPTYYLYEISPSTQPLAAYGTDTILNSTDSNIPDCTFYAERTTPFTIAPNSVDGTGGEITGYNIIYTSSPNTFNSSTGIYTVGITPNIYTTTTASITIRSSQGGSIRLAIVDVNTGEQAALSDLLSTPFGSSVVRTFSSSFPLSGSIVENLLETTQYRVDVIGDGSGQSYTISNFSWAITQSVAAKSSPAFNTVILEPYLYDVFEYSDCNVLINNATEPQYDSDFFKVNYDTGQSIPTNQIQILEGTAERAPVNPSNYTSRAQIYPRYNGTKTTAPNFNASSSDGTGYGGLVVAGNPAPFVGYYTSKGGSTPEVLKKTIINLDYIIDENISTQVPALSDFTIDTQKGLYPRGGYLYLDPDKNSALEQFAGNNIYKIYRSGEYATPILYSQTGSNPTPIPSLNFINPDVDEINDYYNSFIPFYQSTGVIPGGSLNYLYYSILNLNPSLTRWPIAFFGNQFTLPPETGYITGYNNNFTSGIVYSNIKEFRYISSPPSLPNLSINTKAKVTLKVRNLTGTAISPNLSATTLNLKILIYKRDNSPLNLDFSTLQNATELVSQTLTIAAGASEIFEFETQLLTPENNTFIGVAAIVNNTADINSSNLLSPNRLFSVESGIFNIIQDPSPNSAEIFLDDGNYITQVLDSADFITSEGNSSLSFIQFTSSFSQVLGLIYPQLPNSGYDSTIYPFEFPQNYEINLDTAGGWLFGGASVFGTSEYSPFGLGGPQFTSSPPPQGTFDYEIRFNADENQAYPIVGYYYDETNSNFVLAILRPRTAILTSDTVPIENYQSFLIRRWIPRAGYIYLDVDASLGRGIVKPEFITNGIQAKIPQIVKELTDKGLIT